MWGSRIDGALGWHEGKEDVIKSLQTVFLGGRLAWRLSWFFFFECHLNKPHILVRGHSSLATQRANLRVQTLEGTKARVVPDLKKGVLQNVTALAVSLLPQFTFISICWSPRLCRLFLPWHFHASTWMGYVDADTGLFLKTASGFVCSNGFLKTSLKVLVAHLWLSSVLMPQQ